MQHVHSQLAPQKLIAQDGQPVFGVFDGIVDALNVKQFAYYNEMDKPASRLSKYVDFKQFQFVNIITPRYIVALAIADIRYVANGFCYLYDIKANKLSQTQWLTPLGIGCRLSDSPKKGRAAIGNNRKNIAIEIVDGQWHVEMNLADIQANLQIQPAPLSLPLCVCTPTGYNGWTYTQKHNGLAVSGQLTIHHEPQPLQYALAGYDFSAGFMRRETSWRWASINAQTEAGVIGLNLAAGVNETGQTENVMWINGERHLLGAAHFDFNRYSQPDMWHITTNDGQVDLYFRPLNQRSEKLNLIWLKNNFRQYIGYFSGIISDNNGHQYRLHNQLGLTEDHFAKW
ncbi:DUF2804 domain-containing protein [Shewanella inventionis]|uniref:DUF2804 domain-containing protein n=1 Tax=Shewanella inventionis TaxID=1738770 RepID=A0ABQ1J9B5_9GAMM|nr:DUF2804 domain-containing protein [Shewanella inventionis]MCL1158775.1 DUF2804 domain-containing protein [Shewanella inventionis]UAL42918.1 DUF2804 domain-containing protein [Shewanella inventionis]GGB61127.1 DUF2804 domain-containing protein [Shewanella inventionis]